jgi:hypothetical protein
VVLKNISSEPVIQSKGDPVNTSGVKIEILSEEGAKKAREEHLIQSHPLHQLIIHYPSQARALFDK